MIRDLLVPLLHQRSDTVALATAMRLADACQAHLAALVTVATPMPIVTEWGYVPAEVNQLALDAARGEAQRLAEQARRQLAGSALPHEVRVAESVLAWSEDVLAVHAQHADLCLLGGADADALGPRFPQAFKALLLGSGRPVLVVPPAHDPARPLRTAVVAWRPGAPASRAVHDALPLLAMAEETRVVVVDPHSSELGYGENAGADLCLHLARHGLVAQRVALPREGRSVAATLLDYLRESGADLLVMGGYGHSRLRETILGSTTRSVLEGLTVPTLFAH